MDASTLNSKFSIGPALRFVQDPSGLILAEIDNPLATARICLQGAQLLSWRPKSAAVPVVWCSDLARLQRGVSVHSGAPVCWPWFGAHAEGRALPAHGFARHLPWEVTECAAEPGGETRIGLRLLQPVQPAFCWQHAAQLELHLVIGDSLKMELVTSNLGNHGFVISEALHTYFQVGDIERIRLLGLDGATYADKVEKFARHVQQGALSFGGETDRVYLDTQAECLIEDEMLRRRIRIAKFGSRTTVVWTPWQDKARVIQDIGAAGWRNMLCVESANALDNLVTVAPGAVHALAVEYRAEPL